MTEHFEMSQPVEGGAEGRFLVVAHSLMIYCDLGQGV